MYLQCDGMVKLQVRSKLALAGSPRKLEVFVKLFLQLHWRGDWEGGGGGEEVLGEGSAV